jgi:3-hydroxyanthranilate 3,4-dioxygenase
MAEALKPFSLMGWIEEHRDEFRKPVGNKVVWHDTHFIAFVSGANSRNDFHINPGDEIFVQLKGDIRVDLMIDGKRVVNPVREGEVLLVPALVPHAPRRPADTWGFIVERKREPGELDGFAWFCERCDNQLHSVEFQLEDIERQFAGMLEEFNGSEQMRTCERCGELLEVPTEFRMDDQLPFGADAR